MPPEWSPQTAVWLSWPVEDPRHWGGAKHETINACFATFAAAISQFETVRINCSGHQVAKIRALCIQARAVPEHLELFDHPHDDVWCRDHGPIFVRHPKTSEVAITDWDFNAWGGKFPPWDKDDSVPEQIARALEMRRFSPGMILEGGAIEVNGTGQLLTTEAVLLNPNRNPTMSRELIEQTLRSYLGVTEILWLNQGIAGDDTDGHIDDLARFTSDDVIVASRESDPHGPDFKVLEANYQKLQGFRTTSGGRFEIVSMPMPEACEIPGWRLPKLPASYVNFLIVNDGVLVPTFRQPKNDDRALGMLRELFPNRRVVGIDALDLVEEGGSLHCLSQQQPS